MWRTTTRTRSFLVRASGGYGFRVVNDLSIACHLSRPNFLLTATALTSSPSYRSLATSSSSSSSGAASLKKLIQPFVLKCHPDMAAQQGLPNTAVQVNLKAIQNLNSYIDGVAHLEKQTGTGNPFSSQEWVEIEFVMAFQHQASSSSSAGAGAGAAQPTTSRRRVELQVPPPHMALPKVSWHVQRQVVKLLRMADLPIPKLALDNDDEHEQHYDDDNDNSSSLEMDEEWMAGQALNQASSSRGGKTSWDRSRERFLRRINWTKFDKAYQRALRDAQASLETQGLVRDSPKMRKQLLARILSHIEFTDAVQPLERLVAYRRLLRLLDEKDNFEYLQLESFGKYWEELHLVITESRPYNTSSSAMRKRRQRHMETGYRFTIHHDNSVTVQIPVDFQNDELIQELHRNVCDFYEWTQQDALGLQGILEEEGVMV
jgi:hypothetical protein